MSASGPPPVWRGLAEVPASFGPAVAVVGVFDGVHRGHHDLLTVGAAHAQRSHHPLVAVTFDPHPMAVTHPDGAPTMLATLQERVSLLADSGVDAVLVLGFTPELASRTPAEFVYEVLRSRLNVATVVVGENFRFGHRAAGDLATLRSLGAEHDFAAVGVALSGDGEGRFSSSRVRRLLAAGEIARANDVLGRPYAIRGVVAEGDRRGRELGFPTANLAVPADVVAPPDGVYAGWLRVSSPAAERRPDRSAAAEQYPAAISVGRNVTFDGTEPRVEAYALDRDDLDLYGREVSVAFAARLRGMERYDSAEALIAQMTVDVDRARALLG